MAEESYDESDYEDIKHEVESDDDLNYVSELDSDFEEEIYNVDEVYEEIIEKYTKAKSIDFVYNLSDIHIKLKKHYKEQKKVLEELNKYFKKEKILLEKKDKKGVIVITGDILHDREILSSECIDLTVFFLKSLQDLMPTFMILGNHDVNLNNLKQPDSISTIMKLMKPCEELHLLKKTGFYYYRNLVFGVTSILDGNKILKYSECPKKKNKNMCSIALYHGMINKNSTVFKGYDYVMLGDIHKHQYLKEKNMWYVGSLMQQSRKEPFNKHGLIKLDLSNGETEFVEIHNEYGCVRFKINNSKVVKTNVIGKIDIDEFIQSKKYASVEIEFINTNTKDINEIVKDFEKKYERTPIVHVHTDYKLEDINTSGKLLRDKIKIYLKLNYSILTPEDVDKVMKIHASIVKKEKNIPTKMKIESNNKPKYYLKSLSFSNMFSYTKKVVINFGKYDLISNNKTLFISGDNEIGKTSILTVLAYCLYDKLEYSYLAKVINNTCSEFECQVEFYMDDIWTYTIKKTGKRTNGKQKRSYLKKISPKVEFYKTSKDGEVVQLADGTKLDITKEIIKMIGSYDNFFKYNVITCDNKGRFLKMTDSKKFDYLKNLLRLEYFDTLHKSSKIRLSVNTTKLNFYKKKINEYNKTIQTIEQNKLEIDKNNDEYKILKQSLEQLNNTNNCVISIDTLIEKNDALNKYVIASNEIEITLKKIKSIEVLEYSGNKQDIDNQCITKFQRKCELMQKINIVDSNLKHNEVNLESDLNKIIKLHKIIKSHKKNTETVIGPLTDMNESEQNIESAMCISEISQLVNAHKDNLVTKEYIEDCKEEIDISYELTKLIKQKHFVDILFSDNQYLNDLISCKKKYEMALKAHDALNMQEKYAKDVKDIEFKLTRVFDEKRVLEHQNVILEEKCLMHNEYKNNVIKLEHKIKLLKVYSDAVSSNGLPFLLVKTRFPLINEKVNKMMTDCKFNFFDKFEILSEARETTTISDIKNVILVEVSKDHKPYSTDTISNFQRALIDVCIRSACSVNSRLNVFIIDEPFSSADEKNSKNIKNIINYLMKIYGLVILVSQFDSADFRVDKHLHIDNKKGYVSINNIKIDNDDSDNKKINTESSSESSEDSEDSSEDSEETSEETSEHSD